MEQKELAEVEQGVKKQFISNKREKDRGKIVKPLSFSYM